MLGFAPNADLFQINEKIEYDDTDLNDDDQIDIENYKSALNAYYKEEPLTVPEKFRYHPGNVLGGYLIVQSDNVVIKRSVIGRHCKIGRRVVIINSVVADHVTIDEGVKLRNCIVGTNSVLRKNSSLKQCVVMPGFNTNKVLICEKCLINSAGK